MTEESPRYTGTYPAQVTCENCGYMSRLKGIPKGTPVRELLCPLCECHTLRPGY